MAVPGLLTCKRVIGLVNLNFTTGQAIHLIFTDTCSIEAIYMGKQLLRLRHLVAAALEDIATSDQDPSQLLEGFTISTGISLGGLAVVANRCSCHAYTCTARYE
jgi:hypothetical protein